MEEEIWNGTVGKMEETTGECIPIEAEGRVEEVDEWKNKNVPPGFGGEGSHLPKPMPVQ